MALVLCVGALLGGAGVTGRSLAAANTRARVGPHQAFTASVNGSTGEQGRAAIAMACFGPIQPGETGHPMPGQTVGVKLVPAPSSSSTALGYTGDRGTSIGAFFGAPPPNGDWQGASYVRFTSYHTMAIPTSLVLPCSGTGQVTFVALPLDPSERSIAVPVSFVGQP